MTASMQHLLSHKRVLLLQGKMGTFFSRFASFLMTFDIWVDKINVNAGEDFFYKHQATNYTGTLSEFKEWLRQYILDKNIDAVVCFSDCRPYNLRAGQLCDKMGISFFVFEDGYLRPDYITLQEHGINGYSRLDLENIKTLKKANDKPEYTDTRFYRIGWSATTYYAVSRWFRQRFPNYQPYRGMTAWQEGVAWLVVPLLKLRSAKADERLQKLMVTQYDKQYFLVSLQVHNDSQISHHSEYNDVVEFIEEVIISFATHANKKHVLLLKHHPLDRAFRDYQELIRLLAIEHNIEDRVFYGCDMHLPTLIKHSLGMVTINSTTGLQSIYHKRPTKVMGRAIYNVSKLADPKPLAEYWQSPQTPDNEFYGKFREYLIEQTQLNGSFHGKSPWMKKFKPPKHANNKRQ